MDGHSYLTVAILLVYSLSMRSGHWSLRARITADSSRSTASVSASAQDYKSILHTCNLRGHAAPETENERGKKKRGAHGLRVTGTLVGIQMGKMFKVKNDAV